MKKVLKSIFKNLFKDIQNKLKEYQLTEEEIMNNNCKYDYVRAGNKYLIRACTNKSIIIVKSIMIEDDSQYSELYAKITTEDICEMLNEN